MMIQTLISTLHAGYLFNNSALYLLNYISDDIYEARLLNTIIYFIIDSIYLLKNYNKFNKQMLGHHGVCLLFLIPKIIGLLPLIFKLYACLLLIKLLITLLILSLIKSIALIVINIYLYI